MRLHATPLKRYSYLSVYIRVMYLGYTHTTQHRTLTNTYLHPIHISAPATSYPKYLSLNELFYSLRFECPKVWAVIAITVTKTPAASRQPRPLSFHEADDFYFLDKLHVGAINQ